MLLEELSTKMNLCSVIRPIVLSLHRVLLLNDSRKDAPFPCGSSMLSQFAKAFFVATSLAPVVLGYGVVALCDGTNPIDAWPWFLGAAGLALIAYLMPLLALRRLATEQINVKSVEDSDKEILTFLITYLLPLVGKSTLDIGTHTPVTIYVFGIISLAVYHTNTFTFNPLLAMFGYHFFQVETETGMKYLLVTKSVIRQQKIHPWVVKLSDYVYLEGKEPEP